MDQFKKKYPRWCIRQVEPSWPQLASTLETFIMDSEPHVPPHTACNLPSIPNSPLPEMLSFDTQPWQTSLIAAAQQRNGRRPSFLRRHTASEVLPRLYLTDLFTARDEAQLSSLGITHVVSVIEHAPILPQTVSLRTLHIPLSDSSDQDILAHLPVATSFIRNALAESPDSRVLVSILITFIRPPPIDPPLPFRSTVSWASAEARPSYAPISLRRRE